MTMIDRAESTMTENQMLTDRNPDLMPGYMFKPEAAKYLLTTERKISLYVKYGLLRYAKFGKNYVFRKEWLDQFAEDWTGYDLSNEEKIRYSINARRWKGTH